MGKIGVSVLPVVVQSIVSLFSMYWKFVNSGKGKPSLHKNLPCFKFVVSFAKTGKVVHRSFEKVLKCNKATSNIGWEIISKSS